MIFSENRYPLFRIMLNLKKHDAAAMCGGATRVDIFLAPHPALARAGYIAGAASMKPATVLMRPSAASVAKSVPPI
jgi:hypothetical protein